MNRSLSVSPIEMITVLEEIIFYMNDATTRPRGGLNSGKVLKLDLYD